ncbi:MAG: glycosyltransferase [Bacteroidota bacterium]
MPSPERIALFIPYLCAGGAERVTLNVAEGLLSAGYAVDLVVAHADGDYLDQVPSGVRLVDLKSPRVLTSFLPLVRYFKSERPVAMLSALDHANLIAIWARAFSGVDCRLVVAVHSTLSADKEASPRWQDKLVPALVRRFYRKADAIVTVSKSARADFLEQTNLPAGRVHAIYNPVLRPKVFEQGRLLANHPWFEQSTDPVILAVGRLTAAKDYPTLLNAFAQVRKTRSARLLILGEGEERVALEQQATRLGLDADTFQMPGFVSNPYAYMRAADLYVLSSIWEGLPTALIEALALGTPVVSTNCKSGPGEILNDGAYGRLVRPSSPELLAEAILDALGEEPTAVQEEALDRFRVPAATMAYLKLLRPASTADQRPSFSAKPASVS